MQQTKYCNNVMIMPFHHSYSFNRQVDITQLQRESNNILQLDLHQ